MHPSKFFKETNLRTGIDTFEIFDEDLKQKLMQIHPLNFIKTKVTLPVYKVLVSYETHKGNLKEIEKYMVMDSPVDEQEGEYYNEVWAEMLTQDYGQEHSMKNIKVLNVEHICDAVLPIG